jgi:hypothetical protein
MHLVTRSKQRIGSKDQIEAVMCSTMSLDEGARVLWVFLATCYPGGRAPDWLRDQLQLLDFDWSAQILIEARLAKLRAGRLVPLPMLVVAPGKPQGVSEPSPLREEAEAIFDAYNHARRALGVAIPAARTDKTMAKLEELAEWLADSGISVQVWLQFAIERTTHMAAGRFEFVPLHIVTGPWLREEWATAPVNKAASKHAGKTYGDTDSTRALLLAAGFDSMERATDGEVRHIRDWAESMVVDPIGFSEPDPDWAGEIRWLVQRNQQQAKKPARGGR